MSQIVRRARREVEIRRLTRRVSLLADELVLSLENLNVTDAAQAVYDIVPTEVKLIKAKTLKALDKFEDGVVQLFESSVIIALSDEDFQVFQQSGLLNNVDYEILTELDMDQAIAKLKAVVGAVNERSDRIAEMKAFLSDTAIVARYKPGFEEVANSTKSAVTEQKLAGLYNQLYGEFARVLGLNPGDVAWNFHKKAFFFKMSKGLDRMSYLNHTIACDFRLALSIVIAEGKFITELSNLVDALANAMFT
jgi:hypothetical protein